MKVLIIGGTGGIGSALIQRIISSHDDIRLYATYHTNHPQIEHPNLTWFKTDISSDLAIKQLAIRIDSLDILINAAGFLHLSNKMKMPEKSINEFSSEFFMHNLNSNTIPTLLLGKYFAKHLKTNRQTHFISISAKIGSIEDNRIGGWISYRCSKAALNMAIKTISIEWQYKLPNCCVLAFHPGTTDTQLSQPFQKNVNPEKLFSANYVAQCLLKLIDSTSSNDTGKFFSFSGEEIPW
ncbi:SDR family NAD(P)-dependent oxidoreductase [Catenovulum adriaticum]|uniref:SDR family NAD(P)-dependent oxidoreductase n=1 Tax=Catenovulum adriaticum TaxID=2984846 RepID=A0ABY7AM11_9ALTE|nr:SDR family NAD(P)-dependent oxidoreductase [Catenovulum sp. TS8]WAJ70595.1 SDR family NAD(P)-dependent oxidoreductase [Catenovulum sp. TS8]